MSRLVRFKAADRVLLIICLMISPVVFGAVIDATGRWDLLFVASLGVLLGAVLALRMRPDEPFLDDAAVRPQA